MRKFYRLHKGLILVLFVLFLYYLQRLISFRLGINYEEGRDANACLMFLDGKRPYIDFEWLYGTFSFFVYPFLMKLFGINLLVLRISYIILGSLFIPLTYVLARRIMPETWSALAAFLSIIFLDVPYYTYNHVFTVIGELACVWMVCKFIEDRQKKYLILAGVFSLITILTKPILPGISLFAAISLFLIIYPSAELRLRLRTYLYYFLPIAIVSVSQFLYFLSHAAIKKDSLFFVEQASRLLNLKDIFFIFMGRLLEILPFNLMPNLKAALVTSLDGFIFILPFSISLIILLTVFLKRPGKKTYLFLFSICTIFLSLEGLIFLTHIYGRAYTTQTAFILTIYIFYLATTVLRRKTIILAATVLFLVYVSFLHFIRYPYSMLKKFTASLNLKHSGGILVSSGEKQLYESLADYFLSYGKDLVVVGYFPQFAFLTGGKNILEDDEYIFIKLKVASDVQLLSSFEDRVISRMKIRQPEFILTVVSDLDANGLDDLSARLKEFILNHYIPDKVFGPADVFGLEGGNYWVRLYRLNKKL